MVHRLAAFAAMLLGTQKGEGKAEAGHADMSARSWDSGVFAETYTCAVTFDNANRSMSTGHHKNILFSSIVGSVPAAAATRKSCGEGNGESEYASRPHRTLLSPR